MKPDISMIIDGSGNRVFAGLLDPQNQWLAQVDREGAPLENLFPAIEAMLQEAEIALSGIKNYFYCEGPGSVLGLRLCAMAIETWSRLYADSVQLFKYNSLQLTALALLQDRPDLGEALLVADWKKGAWNAAFIRGGAPVSIEVVDAASLADWDGALFHLPQRKGWQSPPTGAQTVAYAPARIAELRCNSTLLTATQGVELYNTGINTFQKWTPSRHRASV